MTITDTGTEPRDAAFGREEAAQHRRLSVELFERDHAYAARLVRVAAAVPSVPSVAEMGGADETPAVIIAPAAIGPSGG
jgi:hypothetical protein